ncbi:MAG: TolC family protein [Gemmatimonadaceae bacterium]|nr:TolC family protein [Gemmatimonadaceae bacterium]MCC6430193.1 TolC family protein [Gemmatimonadaceae bacterium]
MIAFVLALGAALGATPGVLTAQISLRTAQLSARASSPSIRAARAAVSAAAAHERQAGSWANPSLAYGREQTSRGGQRNAQNILQIEQSVEIAGQRGARVALARLRTSAAEARLADAQAELDFEVARLFTAAIAADGKARIAEESASAFTEAQRVSDARLAAGDISGYAGRRLRLEAARHAAVRASAQLERRSARLALATLTGITVGSTDSLSSAETLTEQGPALEASGPDSLRALARRERSDLRAALLDAEASEAESRLSKRERIPSPTVSVGYKGERVADPVVGSLTGFSGYVAGFSMPLPFFDRRADAIAALQFETQRASAHVEVIQRRIDREVLDAYDALAAVDAQVRVLAPHIGEASRVALRAVQLSYAEGEISLLEWLDATRAYHEAESVYITLQADMALRRATLARAVGARISTPPASERLP